MEEERRRLIEHIISIEQRMYRHLRTGPGPEWAAVELTMPQLKVLFLVAGGEGMTMTQVARTLGMTLPTATGVVDRLVSQGLVRRDDDPHDRRVVLLRPTEQGVALVEGLIEASRARIQAILDRLSLDDLRTVARALDILYEAARSLAPGPGLRPM